MSKCELIRDILPLVAEDMASAETKAFVQKHIAFCPECAAELSRMRKEAGQTDCMPDVPLRAVRKEMRKRRFLLVALTALIALCIVLPIVSLMTRPMYKPFDKDTVYVSAKEPGGRAYVDSVLMLDVQNAGWYWAEDPDGEEAALYVYSYDTLYDTTIGKKAMITMGSWPDTPPVTRVYYQQNNGQENVLVWGPETGERQISLPRLALGYYLLLAAAAALALMVAWLFARRRFPRTGRVLAKLFCAPVCYVAAHISILQLDTITYSMQRDCVFIWCMWALLYAACLCALRLRKK